MSNEERWADVPGFDGCYQVSTLGRVRSFAHDKINGRMLKLVSFPNGYKKITLGLGGKQALVHRLVAMVFIPGDHTMQVNHLNGVRDDNRVENLEWLTCSDNHKHSYRELSRKQHSKTKPVILVRHGVEREFAAANHAGKFLSRSIGSVLSAMKLGTTCNGCEVHHAI